ncbi:MAG: ribonuclease P protein component [Myxococcaceae bacterium]|nr:MAG: ribonuclease P protein component [Myxococcaceae bacterium]
MLAARHRITAAPDFRATMRGRRAAGAHLVVHLSLTGEGEPRAGFVVSKAVGVAVVRNRVKRRLRHLMAPRLDRLPAGAMVVVRALPSAAQASFSDLADDLDRSLTRAVQRSQA